jgi:hypothetical protein
MRVVQRKKSVEGAISALTNEKNMAAMGALMMNSLKDNYDRRKNYTAEQCKAFVEEMDFPTFIEVLKGVAAANAKVFGDLGKGLGRAVQEKAEELLGKENVVASPEDQPTDG